MAINTITLDLSALTVLYLFQAQSKMTRWCYNLGNLNDLDRCFLNKHNAASLFVFLYSKVKQVQLDVIWLMLFKSGFFFILLLPLRHFISEILIYRYKSWHLRCRRHFYNIGAPTHTHKINSNNNNNNKHKHVTSIGDRTSVARHI